MYESSSDNCVPGGVTGVGCKMLQYFAHNLVFHFSPINPIFNNQIAGREKLVPGAFKAGSEAWNWSKGSLGLAL